jgi:hypothetical protein
MKLLLYLYEMMSGLKINFSESEVIIINLVPHGGEQDCTVPPQGVAVVRLQH